MSRTVRRPNSVVFAFLIIAASVFGLVVAPAADAADPISYTFRFVNGQTSSGTATDKEHFLSDAGGSSADNPTGMTVHLSCSDKFPGGWGEKDGPEQGVDTAWQIESFFIQKGDKTCGTPTPPEPVDPPEIDIEKFVNGLDADSPTGPEVQVGDTVTLSYEVTNTGPIPLRNIVVTDSDLGEIDCPQTELDPGESMSCDEQTELVTDPGQVRMEAKVVGIGDVLTPGPPANTNAKYAYRFTFVNGQTVVGTANDKEHFVSGAGGTSADNPTGMTVHLSCSDKFAGGWGEKDGPEQGVDTAWQIDSWSIAKLKDGQIDKSCGDPFAVPTEVEVMDDDPIHFIAVDRPDPKIDIEKYVNGYDADTPPGPTVEPGSTVHFSYIVRNTGDVPLTDVEVTDNVVGPITCPKSDLAIGELMACTPTTMTAEPGSHRMEACVSGMNDGREVDDCDPVHYEVPPVQADPKIDIEKYVNGDDADSAPGPTIETGSTATFVYVVRNTGNVPLSNVDVADNIAGAITCPESTLGVDEWMVCSPTTMVAEPGQHRMEACVSGENDGRVVDDCDPVHYKVPPPTPNDPKIDLEKRVNGDSADRSPGPTFDTGSIARFTYEVRNQGDTPLTDIVLVDDVVGELSCPRTSLGIGESMDCETTTMVVEDGETEMRACVKGFNRGQESKDCDPVFFIGK